MVVSRALSQRRRKEKMTVTRAIKQHAEPEFSLSCWFSRLYAAMIAFRSLTWRKSCIAVILPSSLLLSKSALLTRLGWQHSGSDWLSYLCCDLLLSDLLDLCHDLHRLLYVTFLSVLLSISYLLTQHLSHLMNTISLQRVIRGKIQTQEKKNKQVLVNPSMYQSMVMNIWFMVYSERHTSILLALHYAWWKSNTLVSSKVMWKL